MIIGEFCDVFPPELDGVGTVVRNYVKQLNSNGNTCYYVAPKPKKGCNAAVNALHYASIPIPNEAYRLGLPFIDPNYNLNVNKIHFDLVHAHSPFTAGMEAMRIAKQKKIPIVASFHSKYYDDFYSKTHSKILSKEGVEIVMNFFNRCDEVWTVNDSTADVLRSYGFKKQIIIMPNGTDLWYPTDEDCSLAEKRYNLGTGNVFLFVGQHNFKKNIKHILEAVAIYSRSHSDFKMVFVGQGPDAEKMNQLVKQLDIQKWVVFTGQIMDRTVMMGLYGRADLLVFPSLYDNAPMVVREAAAAQTPSLLVKGACAAEGISHNINGFLCEDTPEQIAEGMWEALSSCKEVGKQAQATIPLAWSNIAKQVLARYESLIIKQ